MHIRRRTIFYAHHKEPHEPLQRILIHRIDQGKVNDTEEKQRSSVGNRPVPFSSLIDLLLSYFAFLHSFVNLLTRLLGVRKLIDERLILQKLVDVSFSAR